MPSFANGKITPVKLAGPFQKYLKKMVNSSFLLILAAVSAVIWANLSYDSYHHFWKTDITFSIGHHSLTKSLSHWIDEALMVLFFFSVGLEIKREILVGELASVKKAILPIMAAIGGMVVPALIYMAFNYNTQTAIGWGIPMATDIAFSIAILAILGDKIPVGVRIFLTALAIADDLGAVLVIGLFYTSSISVYYLLIALFFLLCLTVANILWIRWTIVYVFLGFGLWFAILSSGIHATVAGVLVALFIPAQGKYDTQTFLDKIKAYINRFECQKECGYTILVDKNHLNAVHDIEMACHDVETPLQRLDHGVHAWVSYFIVPLFALANSGIVLSGINIGESLTHSVALGIICGLVIGKPLGIMIFTFISVKMFKTTLTNGVTWMHLIGASCLAGIGFTMSLFISGLSFTRPEIIEISKLSIVVGSLISAFLGLTILLKATSKK